MRYTKYAKWAFRAITLILDDAAINHGAGPCSHRPHLALSHGALAQSMIANDCTWGDEYANVRALFTTGPVESIEFECGDGDEAMGEFPQGSTVSGGKYFPVLEVGDGAFDG
jgi:hypothetical protein